MNDRSSKPVFDAPEGRFAVDYRDHDGRIVLGHEDWIFETMWGVRGPGGIYILNDPAGIRGVAVAPNVNKIGDVTPAVFASANFTSRHRSPQAGEVVLIENTSGYAVAIELIAVTLTPESQPGTHLDARYRILTDKSRDFSRIGKPETDLIEAIGSALQALADIPFTDGAHEPPSLGHNNPPPEAALTPADYANLGATLREIRESTRARTLTAAQAAQARVFIFECSKAIRMWVAHRLAMIEEGAFQAIGGLSVGLAAYLLAGGKLDGVVSLLQLVGEKLLGGS